ncbi:hypothetical protein [Metabacillus indicus]|uniref:hypothetical protein n=1 Tax=Metabacillus indicus TaxID=246786 RepID=UPI003CF24B58
MFGELEVNDYHMIKYSMLYEFFDYFSSISLLGLPLAQCLSRLYLLPHLQPFVDENVKNHKLIEAFRKQHDFKSMGEINQKLLSFEKIAPVKLAKNKTSILLADDYFLFAADQLSEYDITLYGVHETEFPKPAPKKFQRCIFRNELLNISKQTVARHQTALKKQVDAKLKQRPNHFYFSTPAFQKWIGNACITIIKWTVILDQLILKAKPAVIINPSEASIFGTILGLLSKKYQIPFVNMPLTTIGDLNFIPSRADYYFAWGKDQKEWFIKRLVPEEHVFDTGNVKFFYDRKDMAGSKETFMNDRKIPNQFLLVGYTTQPYLNTNEQVEQWISSAANQTAMKIIVKKHRNDKYDYPLLKKQKNVLILEEGYPLYEFLHHIDILMTIASTTAFEGALLDKPLLILQPKMPYHYVLNHNRNVAYFSEKLAGETIKNGMDFLSALNKINTDPGYLLDLKKRAGAFKQNTLVDPKTTPAAVKKKLAEIMHKHNG